MVISVAYLTVAGTPGELGRSFPKAVIYISVNMFFGIPISTESMISFRLKRRLKWLSRSVSSISLVTYVIICCIHLCVLAHLMAAFFVPISFTQTQVNRGKREFP